MERTWYWRLALIVGLSLLATYAALPSFLYLSAPPEVRRSKAELKKRIPTWLPKSRMSFGIDLQGGLHLVMGVDADKAVQHRADRIGDELIDDFKTKNPGKTLKGVRRPGEG